MEFYRFSKLVARTLFVLLNRIMIINSILFQELDTKLAGCQVNLDLKMERFIRICLVDLLCLIERQGQERLTRSARAGRPGSNDLTETCVRNVLNNVQRKGHGAD